MVSSDDICNICVVDIILWRTYYIHTGLHNIHLIILFMNMLIHFYWPVFCFVLLREAQPWLITGSCHSSLGKCNCLLATGSFKLNEPSSTTSLEMKSEHFEALC